ncbi:MAG: nuclear transport factor 2 family protein [Bacteroidetes bacterium]|nr:nuclear transport factor 2 family protein [Bacteroidota bacterium]
MFSSARERPSSSRWKSVRPARSTARYESFAAGYKTNLAFEDLDLVFFDDVVCSTGYLTGAVTLPGGEPESVVWRLTVMLIKEEGQWKMVHTHSSPMASEN